MSERSEPALKQAVAAAQAWWHDAGVDLAFRDEPAGWLAPAPSTEPSVGAGSDKGASLPAAPPAPPEPPPMGGDRTAWPQDLPGFRGWWLEDPSLGETSAYPAVPPRGASGAELMMLVPMPEPDDRDMLLAGPQGRLLAAFAAAMGLAPEQVYWASALPRHTALPDWDGLARRGLGAVVRHHLELADPARIIVFGNRILPLFGHDPAQGAPAINQLEIHGTQKPVLATYAPERLLGSARQRAGLWQRWLEWTGRDE